MSLGAFFHLTTLALKNVSIGKGCLCSALDAMPLLADLSVVNVSFLSDAPLPTSHCSMTRLTSFEFRLVSCEDNSVWRWIENGCQGVYSLEKAFF